MTMGIHLVVLVIVLGARCHDDKPRKNLLEGYLVLVLAVAVGTLHIDAVSVVSICCILVVQMVMVAVVALVVFDMKRQQLQ
jgi:hypothetical protein